VSRKPCNLTIATTRLRPRPNEVTKGALDGSWSSPHFPECPNNNAEHLTHPPLPSGVFLFPGRLTHSSDSLCGSPGTSIGGACELAHSVAAPAASGPATAPAPKMHSDRKLSNPAQFPSGLSLPGLLSLPWCRSRSILPPAFHSDVRSKTHGSEWPNILT
jgi:hypothetical protein